MHGDVAGIKAQLDAVLNSMEDATAGLQASLEKAESATGGLILVMEGSGDPTMADAAAISAHTQEAIEQQINNLAVAMEQIRSYQATL